MRNIKPGVKRPLSPLGIEHETSKKEISGTKNKIKDGTLYEIINLAP